MKRKDALTDLVEHAQDAKPAEPQTSASGNREVAGANGEVVTLGLEKDKQVRIHDKGKYLELSVGALQRIVQKEIEKALKEFSALVLKKVDEKLAEK
jgi:hypothetical protein